MFIATPVASRSELRRSDISQAEIGSSTFRSFGAAKIQLLDLYKYSVPPGLSR